MPRNSLSVALISEYFSVVKTLQDYLSQILDQSAESVPPACESTTLDGPSYRLLLSTTYVASNESSDNPIVKPYFPVMVDMREVIDKAQEKIFRRSSEKRPKNMLTLGYKRASAGVSGKDTRLGISNHFVNTIVTAFQGQDWRTLLQRVGEDTMLHLLTDTFIFVSLPNDCLCQMTGEPIILKHPPPCTLGGGQQHKSIAHNNKRSYSRMDDPEMPLAKCLKLDSERTRERLPAKNPMKILPMDITFPRGEIFYARPRQVPDTNLIIVGLHAKHILNILVPAYRRRPKVQPGAFRDPDPKIQEQNARHLAKYVFPRQYGLTNPFLAEVSRGKTARYADRESELKDKGRCKTPKRLKHVLPILEQMIYRHGRCAYKPLRDKLCPSKLNTAEDKKLDSSIILELVSEQSFVLRTQGSLADDSNASIMPCGLTQAERQAKMKPRFVEFACPAVEVFRYIVLVTKVVIPRAFWGSDENFKVVLRHLKDFIQCRRCETLTLHHVLQGFSTSQCDWLMPPGIVDHGRVSVSDMQKRRELLEEFLFWYFDSFVISLLKTNFYITESQAFRKKVLYFRQDDWKALCAPLIERLTSDTFVKISQAEAQEIMRQRQLGFSFVRLLPKETGVRPIVNLRRRATVRNPNYSYELSINQILRGAFEILKFERDNQPRRLGASVADLDAVYTKLKNFKSRLPRNPDGSLPQLFFVKVDVQACYDTIDQAKLLNILRELLTEDAYIVQRYGTLQKQKGRIRRVFNRRAIPDDDHPHFLKYAADLAVMLKARIFVDQVEYQSVGRDAILHLLEEHITDNIVKIGPDYFRQIIGIPQGSVLSSLLCSFFYGDLEKCHSNFLDDPRSILLRWTDDYLFITMDCSQATQFLQMMNKGHPEYGCFISKDKTLTNFDFDSQIMNVTVAQQSRFPWCGVLIGMADLSVTVDYTRYHGTSLHDSLTVFRGRKQGTAFVNKMLGMARNRNHPIYSCGVLNSEQVIYLNIYQNLLLSAKKMHCYLCNLGARINRNAAFVFETIRKTIAYSYVAINDRSIHAARRQNSGEIFFSPIRKTVVIWLGNFAFYTVLNQKPQLYATLLRSLKLELSRPRSRRYEKQFSGVVKGGADVLQIPS